MTDIIIDYLNYDNYHETLFNKELGNINIYAHRTIICIRKYVNLLEKHPILDGGSARSSFGILVRCRMLDPRVGGSNPQLIWPKFFSKFSPIVETSGSLNFKTPIFPVKFSNFHGFKWLGKGEQASGSLLLGANRDSSPSGALASL